MSEEAASPSVAVNEAPGPSASSKPSGPPEKSGRRSHGALAGRMLALAFAMFGFGYLMVPLYDIVCDLTGLNGKTGRVTVAEAEAEARTADATAAKAGVTREVTVEFIANVPAAGSWIFRPSETSMKAVPGKQYAATYYAENLRDVTVVGQATPSVSPFTAAAHFNKTECFCFTRQVFEPKSGRDMPLVFVIDPELPANIDRVTLSYTFFNSPDQQS